MRLKKFVTLILPLIAIANLASACPVCYGATDAHTASAVNAAIVSLLLVVGAVLSFFASLILRVRKRIKLASTQDSNELH